MIDTSHPNTDAERFRIEGGDGDQEFFSEKRILKQGQAPWFHERFGEWYGDAMLFVTEGGAHDGEYVVLTPRTIGNLREKFARDGWASVVVHRIINPTIPFDVTKSAKSIGMGVVTIVGRPQKTD